VTSNDSADQAAVAREVDALVARVFFVIAGVVCLGALGVVLTTALSSQREIFVGGATAALSFAGLLAGAAQLARRGRLHVGVALALAATMACATLFAVWSRLGIHALILGAYGTLIVVAAAVVGMRVAAALTAVCALALAGMYAAEGQGYLLGREQVAAMPAETRVLTHLLIVAMAALFGWMLSRTNAATLGRAQRQERRFRKLLEIAADWYWEQDEQFRFTSISASYERRTGLAVADQLGRPTWALPEFELTPARWSAHRADLDARRPFHDFVLKRRTADGRSVYLSLSGEPMFDDRNRFVGYWGVGRDVTDALEARRALEAAESRYRNLFARSPSPFIIHRAGSILAANDAAAQFFGYAAPEAMRGLPMLALNHADSRELSSRRLAALEAMPAGGSLPSVELRLARADGGAVLAQVSVVRIELDDGLANLSIHFDLTERRAAEAALAQAKEAAEAASRAKSAFLANTSHEIRTPLNGLIGLVRLALDGRTGVEQKNEYLRRIADSAQALTGIISNILDLSKIEAGKLEVEHVDFDLREVLAAACAAHRALAAEKGLGFALHSDDAVPSWVSGDPVRVRQILTNFMSNAVKFTSRGRIDVRITAPAVGRVRFAVDDTGPGIDAATQERLFRPFSQGDESTTRRFGGTGLGLSICRQLAEKMGGAIGVDSRPGRGSTFWAELPLPAVAARDAAPAATPEDDATLQGARVLLVEDNPVNLLVAETLLANWGVEVVKATDGRQAVEAVEREAGRFDAVLMDVHMPVMSGYEATAAIRRSHDREDLPVIALTAAALVSEQEQCLKVGMNDFITKPFDADRLRISLAHWTRRRRSVQRV
jgi:PAS domain S-box-containing protein